jgi:hypothetical protein
MKRITKYILLTALLLNASYAVAWPKIGHETVATIATEELKPSVRKQVEHILGGNMASVAGWFDSLCKQPGMEHTAQWHYLHLDAHNQPTGCKDDALYQVERYSDILRNRTNHSKALQLEALRALIHLVSDMHCIAYVRLADEPLSEEFNFTYPKMTSIKGKVYMGKSTWHKLWYLRFFNNHQGFTPQMFAENILMAYASQRDDYAKGTPRDWATEMGMQTRSLLVGMSDGIELPHKQVNLYEDIHEQNVAKAAYRLAALLNEIFR